MQDPHQRPGPEGALAQVLVTNTRARCTPVGTNARCYWVAGQLVGIVDYSQTKGPYFKGCEPSA